MTQKKNDAVDPVSSRDPFGDAADEFYADQKNHKNQKMEPIKTDDAVGAPALEQSALATDNSDTRFGPGYIKLECTIEVHTRQAYGLVLGREHKKRDGKTYQNPLLGLFAFAARTYDAINASDISNPYADMLLVTLEHLLVLHDEALDRALKTIDDLIKINITDRDMKIKLATSKRPQELTLSFFSPYAYELAMQLVKYDRVVRTLFPLRQMRIISYEEWLKIFNEAYSLYVRIVNPFIQFRGALINITREQYLQHFNSPDPIMKNALRVLGDVPEEILDQSLMPQTIFLKSHNKRPEIKSKTLHKHEEDLL